MLYEQLKRALCTVLQGVLLQRDSNLSTCWLDVVAMVAKKQLTKKNSIMTYFLHMSQPRRLISLTRHLAKLLGMIHCDDAHLHCASAAAMLISNAGCQGLQNWSLPSWSLSSWCRIILQGYQSWEGTSPGMFGECIGCVNMQCGPLKTTLLVLLLS